MKIRKAKESEFLKIHEFVKTCRPLEVYPAHFYKIMLRYFNKICFIAEEAGSMIGFAFGLAAQNPSQTCFFWQIGVNRPAQGKGIGKRLVQFFEKEIKKSGFCRIELTVDLENTPSQKLFEKLGYKNISSKEPETVTNKRCLAAKNYYGLNRHFIVYEKKL